MNALPWSSSAALPPTENQPIAPVIETAGSDGSAESKGESQQDLLVFGKSDVKIKPKGVRVGNETVLGTDDRVRITNTKAPPWRKIAGLKLKPRPPQTSSYIGTGWFIGPKVSLSVFTSDNPRRLSGLSPLEPESLVVRLSPSLVNAISADLTRLISPARLVSTLGLRKESTSAPVCGLLLRQDHLRNRAD